MFLIVTPCEKHGGADKEVQKKCKDCKKEYVSFIWNVLNVVMESYKTPALKMIVDVIVWELGIGKPWYVTMNVQDSNARTKWRNTFGYAIIVGRKGSQTHNTNSVSTLLQLTRN